MDKHDRKAGADVFFLDAPRFGINEARTLKGMAFRKPVERDYRTFILTFSTITTEAQNALLKLFEEPPSTARFHIIVPREDILISTLRSRVAFHDMPTASRATTVALQFLQSSYRDRLETIAARAKAADMAWMEAVVNGSEVYFEEQGAYAPLKEIAFVRSYFHASGASKKMLLEHLALTLPVIS
jgi:hypothetical protein